MRKITRYIYIYMVALPWDRCGKTIVSENNDKTSVTLRGIQMLRTHTLVAGRGKTNVSESKCNTIWEKAKNKQTKDPTGQPCTLSETWLHSTAQAKLVKTIEKPKRTKRIKGVGPKKSKTIEKNQTNQKHQRSEQLWRAWRLTQTARTRFWFLGFRDKHSAAHAKLVKTIEKPKKNKTIKGAGPK